MDLYDENPEDSIFISTMINSFVSPTNNIDSLLIVFGPLFQLRETVFPFFTYLGVILSW